MTFEELSLEELEARKFALQKACDVRQDFHSSKDIVNTAKLFEKFLVRDINRVT